MEQSVKIAIVVIVCILATFIAFQVGRDSGIKDGYCYGRSGHQKISVCEVSRYANCIRNVSFIETDCK